ncbi:MAG: ABC transporter permease [Bacteroidota bacterium]
MKNNNNTPPPMAQHFLCWFLKDDLAEEVLGDLEEKYYATLDQKSVHGARLNYWFQVFNYLRPFALKKYRSNSKYLNMHPHNFKIAYRHFLRNRTSFLINFFSLTIGLTCSLFIYLWASDELKTDQFHINKDHLYQVLQNDINPDDVVTEPYTPGILARTLAEELPQVKRAVSVVPYEWFEGEKLLVSDGKGKIFTSKNQFASSEYFNLFSFELLQGDKDEILARANQVVISDELSQKLFNTTDALGKSLEWHHEDFGNTYQVSGVFKKISKNSTLQFDAVFHYDVFLDDNEDLLQWNNSDPYTYVLIEEQTNIPAFKATIKGFLQTKIDIKNQDFYVQKFSDRYLNGKYENGVAAGGRITYVRLFISIAAIVLLVACINFMNMTTAESTNRMKEIGIKKAIGVRKNSLIAQYLTESILMSSVALIAALLIVFLLLPQFNLLVEKSIDFSFDPWTVIVLITITLTTGIISGLYPAFILSRLSPISALKGTANLGNKTWTARKTFVVLQFFVSTFLVVSVIVIYQQIDYIQSKNLGYDKENIIWFTAGLPDKPGEDNELTESDIEILLQRLKDTPGVENASNFAHNMIGDYGTTTGLSWQGKQPDQRVLFAGISAGYDFINTMKIEINEGRSFSRDFKSDIDKIILNEKAISTMNMVNPIGKTINLWDKEREIIGVLKDYHIDMLYKDIPPAFIKLDLDNFASNFMVRLEPGSEKETIARVENVYKDFFVSGMPFEFKFLDENYQELYQQEIKIDQMAKYAMLMVIFISGLGLFGFASFVVSRRVKEIGIRKVLGASRLKVVHLLTSGFTELVVLSLVLALPLAFLVAEAWLASFAYRISLEWWFFALSGLIVITFSWVTVGFRTISAAQINPVDCLKDE